MSQIETEQRLCSAAERICGQGDADELIEIYLSCDARRQWKAGGHSGVGAPAMVKSGLLRLVRGGRDVYCTLSTVSEADLRAALAACRSAVADGRLVLRMDAPARDAAWDDGIFRNQQATDGPSRLRAGSLLRDTLVDSLAAAPASLNLIDAVITEEDRFVVHGSSGTGIRTFGRRTIDLNCLAGSDSAQFLISRQSNSVGGLDVADVADEATWRHAAATAAGTERNLPELLLLTPHVAAQLLMSVTEDLILRTQPAAAPFPIARALLDEGRLPCAPRSVAFDQEGTPSGETVLVSRAGELGSLVARSGAKIATPRSENTLTGHARRLPFQTVPEAWPHNVRIEHGTSVIHPPGPCRVAYEIQGHGVQRFRSGQNLTLRLSTSHIRDGAITAAGGVVVLYASALEILRAVIDSAPVRTYRQTASFAAGGGWLLLDVSALRPTLA